MSAEWIEFNGKKILYVDYKTAGDTTGMIALLEKEVQMLKSAQGKSLLLNDFTGTTFDDPFVDRARALGTEIDAYSEKAAVLGMTGPKKILLKAYNFVAKANLTPFKNEEKAKEYLVN